MTINRAIGSQEGIHRLKEENQWVVVRIIQKGNNKQRVNQYHLLCLHKIKIRPIKRLIKSYNKVFRICSGIVKEIKVSKNLRWWTI